MKKDKILNALENSDKNLTVEEISEKTNISETSLRTYLYRLQEEGEIENIEEEDKIKWKSKTSEEMEEKYEKMSESGRRG